MKQAFGAWLARTPLTDTSQSQAPKSAATNGLARVAPPPSSVAQDVRWPEAIPTQFAAAAVMLRKLTVDQVAAAGTALDVDADAASRVALDRGWMTQADVEAVLDALTAKIHVDSRARGNPAFLAWVEDLKRQGLRIDVQTVTAKQLAETAQAKAQTALVGQDNLANAERLLYACAKIGVTDLHIILRPQHAEVVVRINGELRVVREWSMRHDDGEQLARAMCTGLTAVKDASYEPFEFQRAQIPGDRLPGSGLTSVRIERGPAYPVESGGGFLAARLQYSSHTAVIERSSGEVKNFTLDEPDRPAGEMMLGTLGYTPMQIELIDRLLGKPHGLLITTGPTGSGKSTTQFEFLVELARLAPSLRQITIEEPVEYPLPTAIQLPAKEGEFGKRVSNALRMDPDIIQIGEIRNASDGIAAVNAALSGHLVLSTLHVITPYHVVSRFEQLDRVALSREIICDPQILAGVIAQRIVPVLCSCKVRLTESRTRLPKYLSEAVATWGPLSNVCVRGPGCPTCRGTGIASRAAIAEVLISTPELTDDLINLGPFKASRLHRMRPGSDKSMLANAMDRVMRGELSPLDVQQRISIEVFGEGV